MKPRNSVCSEIRAFKYSSKPYDSATGTILLRRKILFCFNGRFITEGTYVGNISDPLSQNRYIYVENNPETLIDPICSLEDLSKIKLLLQEMESKRAPSGPPPFGFESLVPLALSSLD